MKKKANVYPPKSFLSDMTEKWLNSFEKRSNDEFSEWTWSMYQKYGEKPNTRENWYEFEERLYSGDYDENIYDEMLQRNELPA